LTKTFKAKNPATKANTAFLQNDLLASLKLYFFSSTNIGTPLTTKPLLYIKEKTRSEEAASLFLFKENESISLRVTFSII